jgi:TRAP-type mannitol/chloroaromatic compound transport system permease small subunit
MTGTDRNSGAWTGTVSASEDGASPDGGAPSSLLDKISGSMNALGSLWIFVLMILINIDAIGRTWFASPMDGVIELIELSLIGIIFLQLADATRCGRLTRSDGFFNMIQRRKPVAGRYLGILFEGLGILFMLIILWGSVPILIESWVEDFYVGEEGIFTAPVWPVKLVIVIGCVVTALQFASFGWRYLVPGKGSGEGAGQ